jgi:hypothetical protein
VLKTIDAGATWKPLPTLTTNDFLSVFFTNANTGYVAGVGGTILKTITGGVVSVENELSKVTDFTIFPNPASGKIYISSGKKMMEELSISIFSLQGKELINMKYHPQSPVETDINALVKGVYLVRIQTRTVVEVKKFVKQ